MLPRMVHFFCSTNKTGYSRVAKPPVKNGDQGCCLSRAGSSCIAGLKKTGRGLVHAAAPLGSSISQGADKTANYIKDNWQRLVCYLVAWAIVIACSGFVGGIGGGGIAHGFMATSIPLMIGLGCGIAFGSLVGLLTVKFIFPNNEHQGHNTAWGFINTAYEKVSDFGTRQIMLSVAVTVVLALTQVQPYAAGGVFGLVIGNHFVAKLGYGVPLGPDPLKRKTPAEQIAEMKEKFKNLQADFERLQVEDVQKKEQISARKRNALKRSTIE